MKKIKLIHECSAELFGALIYINVAIDDEKKELQQLRLSNVKDAIEKCLDIMNREVKKHGTV